MMGDTVATGGEKCRRRIGQGRGASDGDGIGAWMFPVKNKTLYVLGPKVQEPGKVH